MKRAETASLLILLVTVLTGCGGDSGSGNSIIPAAITNPDAGIIADASSAKYASALRAFAESYTGLIGIDDLCRTRHRMT